MELDQILTTNMTWTGTIEYEYHCSVVPEVLRWRIREDGNSGFSRDA